MSLFDSVFDNLLCLPNGLKDLPEDPSLPGIALEASLHVPIKGFVVLESKIRCKCKDCDPDGTEAWVAVSLTHDLAAAGGSQNGAVDNLRDVVAAYVENAVRVDSWSGKFYLPKAKSPLRLRFRLRVMYWLVKWGVWPNAGCTFDTVAEVKMTGPWRCG